MFRFGGWGRPENDLFKYYRMLQELDLGTGHGKMAIVNKRLRLFTLTRVNFNDLTY